MSGIWLALETSADLGSVAAGPPGRVVAFRWLTDRGRHAQALLPALEAVLAEAGVRVPAGVVVGAGPGSFTGVRIAAAVAKGLVRAVERPLHAVPSTAAAAFAATRPEPREGPWQPVPGVDPVPPAELVGRPLDVLFDARGERLYAARYRAVAGRLEEERAPHATDLSTVLGDLDADAVLVGSGALRPRARLASAGATLAPPPAGFPSAAALLHLVEQEPWSRPIEDPGTWEPLYVRPWRPSG